jgi:hypothetical protein
LIFNTSQRLERQIFDRQRELISTYRVAGKRIGFFVPQATFDPNPVLTIVLNADVIRHTACVFFVPTKLRVYRDEMALSVQDRIIEPPPSYQVLARTYAPFGLSVIDLTPDLRNAARIALKEGNFVFWRDDTHWNGRGMAAVAGTVADCMRSNDGARQQSSAVGGARTAKGPDQSAGEVSAMLSAN